MGYRAVCRCWRSATDDPRGASARDPRFRPRHWAMLDEVFQTDARLFANAATGRFLRMDLPLLGRGRRYRLVASAPGGDLVLAEASPPARGARPQPVHRRREARRHDALRGAAALRGRVRCPCHRRFAHPRPARRRLRQGLLRRPRQRRLLRVRGELRVRSHQAGRRRWPLRRRRRARVGGVDPGPRGHQDGAPSRRQNHKHMSREPRVPLLRGGIRGGSAAHLQDGQKDRADLQDEHGRGEGDRSLEEVKSIGGGRAIFVGATRCISINADKFNAIDGNRIYYQERDDLTSADIYMYELESEETTKIGGAIDSLNPVFLVSTEPPFSPIQLFCSYADEALRFRLEWEKIVQSLPERLPDDIMASMGADLMGDFEDEFEDFEYEFND
ncbi:Os03g0783800 [Oryza sativa Japonica Group]|uniref:Expressed protein n=4 Tax=Oryza sativa subsp. japonica TaxID=39947 RepID=Q10CG4_ORYSJ|nr:hypothetical protein [Oryza sativa Japonica Group]KAB8093852.1 hypothetical protein EE612_020835 [Oryza sativa]ABF99210.1 expressed protein [Oryza sativa Japonica Group]KAF2941674.1 hypothetical protein DAI22_03g364200 [Oryza sativa Japonica Group]BAH92389.1 Os03g0783800 [Oryza sativa Japonica Group]|eukprot:NP_001173661.1 Os03g0783800 [Oryza sativa Japonica Group]